MRGKRVGELGVEERDGEINDSCDGNVSQALLLSHDHTQDIVDPIGGAETPSDVIGEQTGEGGREREGERVTEREGLTGRA
jgi:hypothetical protein